MITARALNRATLHRQLLLERADLAVPEAVRQVVAIQAQHAASPYVALWARLRDLDASDVDAAFDQQSVVKASLVRITLHAVHVDDHAAFREAMEPAYLGQRLARVVDHGIAVDDALALVPGLLDEAADGRTATELLAWLAERLGPVDDEVWTALRAYVPFLHRPGTPPWSYGYRVAYTAPGRRPALAPGQAARSLPHLVRRYLEGFGPATLLDVAQFAKLARTSTRAAVAALDDQLADERGEGLVRLEGPDGVKLLDVADDVGPDEDVPAPPRLLPMWDSTLLAYADRSRMIPPEHRTTVIRSNGDVLPTMLVDGRVAGVWRAVPDGVELTALDPLPDDAWAGLEADAASLHAFLADRDPEVYRRHHRWWPVEGAGGTRTVTA